jgi:hypothetical protein
VTKLLVEAKSMAKSRRQPVSEAAAMDLEATLDAAFADPKAAEAVRASQLTTALHYSGLGLADSASASPVRASRAEPSGAATAAAKRDLELANREAERAHVEAEKARQAVALAEDDLKRLKTTAALAVRRAADAHKKASVAKKR